MYQALKVTSPGKFCAWNLASQPLVITHHDNIALLPKSWSFYHDYFVQVLQLPSRICVIPQLNDLLDLWFVKYCHNLWLVFYFATFLLWAPRTQTNPKIHAWYKPSGSHLGSFGTLMWFQNNLVVVVAFKVHNISFIERWARNWKKQVSKLWRLSLARNDTSPFPCGPVM